MIFLDHSESSDFRVAIEILRLVYKKTVFLNVERKFLAYLKFYPPEIVALPLIKVGNIFFEKGCNGHQKICNICWFQKGV